MVITFDDINPALPNIYTIHRACPAHLSRFMLFNLYLGLAGVAGTGQGGQEFRS